MSATALLDLWACLGNDSRTSGNDTGRVDQARPPLQKLVIRELALFLGLLFLGLVLLPIAIYFVGGQVFGDYAGAGFTGFFNSLGGKIRQGDWVAWFLVLAPYLGWQTIRLTRFLWATAGRSASSENKVRN